ncbi:MAG TPA: carbamoyltransferase C-terminal domain-containing protein [Candidatus Acidoferrales bacterium]|nr:carbamoyltransferase C-terminal domain-containing protein [Candidatus Acidoferrales bacterium]
MIILGINAYHANASAAILVDGRLVAAVEEERLNRVKYAAGMPALAIQYCLQTVGAKIDEVDHIAVPRNPWARLGTKLAFACRMPRFALERFRVAQRFAGIKDDIAAVFHVDPKSIRARVHRVEHHRAHLASAFFVSPHDHAAVLSADGLGDFASTMWGVGEGPRLRISGAVAFPHSLGMFYTALTQYLGFWKFGDEYKVMGLAAYGSPTYLDEFRNIVRAKNPIGFRLDLSYFTHHRGGPEMTWRKSTETPVLGRLFSPFLENRLGTARATSQPLEDRHRNVAATMQVSLEKVLITNLTALQKRTGAKTLCLAGGVAFNCLANGKIPDRTPFERVFVQPAAGDAGLSVGAAYFVHHEILRRPRCFTMDHAFWGPGFNPQEVKGALVKRSSSAQFQIRELDEAALLQATADHLALGKVVGWFQGRTEWGPRALGNRSILADPRRAQMKEVLNDSIKHREPFRPFAPAILEESAAEYFERSHPSPFMTFALPVRQPKRAVIPAVTHADGTARLQTVSRTSHPLFWRLLRAFGDSTGVPVLLNTSFNDNEPVVCRPEEALSCFERTKMDVLVLGNLMLEKHSVAPSAGNSPAMADNKAH